MSILVDVATDAGALAKEISRKEGWGYLQEWREVYCAPVHKAIGKWVVGGVGGCAWHTFSGGFFPCIQKQRALDQYGVQDLSNLLALSEDDHIPSIRLKSAMPVDFSGLNLDVYVAPESYDWTIVFTHEHPDYGPFFARRDWILDQS